MRELTNLQLYQLLRFNYYFLLIWMQIKSTRINQSECDSNFYKKYSLKNIEKPLEIFAESEKQ